MRVYRFLLFLCLAVCMLATPDQASSAKQAPLAGKSDPAAAQINKLPGLVDVAWLAEHLKDPMVRIIDCRTQPDYNKGHIPGSAFLFPESLRGNIGGMPSMILPARMLAEHLSLLGVTPKHTLVFVHEDKIFDATLESMAALTLRHPRYAVLSGGFPAWKAAGKPVDTLLPSFPQTRYRPPLGPNSFMVDSAYVRAKLGSKTPIIDVRENALYTGAKVDDARGGHIPGAINRPLAEDTVKQGDAVFFKPVDELAKAYAAIIADKRAEVIVHCRTGREASQTYFVLTTLLGYTNVKFYDPGWTDWAANPALPVETGEGKKM